MRYFPFFSIRRLAFLTTEEEIFDVNRCKGDKIYISDRESRIINPWNLIPLWVVTLEKEIYVIVIRRKTKVEQTFVGENILKY